MPTAGPKILIGNVTGIEDRLTITNTEIGALTETAPTTDTASSGLNGRLQRIAQKLSAISLQLPFSIGQKTSSNSISIVTASDQLAARSLSNGTTTNLAANATFPGVYEDLSTYATTVVSIKSSSAGTLVVEYSNDGITTTGSRTFNIPAGVLKLFNFPVIARYARVNFINGPVAQTFFALNTTYKLYSNNEPPQHGSPKNIYSEVSAIASGIETTVLTYTVPAARSFFLDRIHVEGENISDYKVKVNGSVIGRRKTYFTNYAHDFDFGVDVPESSGLELAGGDVLLVTATHNRPGTSDFWSRAQGLLV